jgi:hypothetical protein
VADVPGMSITPSVLPHAPAAEGEATSSPSLALVPSSVQPVEPPLPAPFQSGGSNHAYLRVEHAAVARADLKPYALVPTAGGAHEILRTALNTLPRERNNNLRHVFELRSPRHPVTQVVLKLDTSAGEFCARDVVVLAALYEATEAAALRGATPTIKDIAACAGVTNDSARSRAPIIASVERLASVDLALQQVLPAADGDPLDPATEKLGTKLFTLAWATTRRGASIGGLAFSPPWHPSTTDLLSWLEMRTLRGIDDNAARVAYIALAGRASRGDVVVGNEVYEFSREEMLDLCGLKGTRADHRTRDLQRAIAALVAADVVTDVRGGRYTTPWKVRMGRALYPPCFTQFLRPDEPPPQRVMGVMLRAYGISPKTATELTQTVGLETLRGALLTVMYHVKNGLPLGGRQIKNRAGAVVELARHPEKWALSREVAAWRDQLRLPPSPPVTAPAPIAPELALVLRDPTTEEISAEHLAALRQHIERVIPRTALEEQMLAMLKHGRLVRDANRADGWHWQRHDNSAVPARSFVAINLATALLSIVAGESLLLRVEDAEFPVPTRRQNT